ncbi:MAG: hypothetical protein KA271_00910 [Propionivibrio sp.]|nr:hypothetical protein [Propionivibrio sp.]
MRKLWPPLTDISRLLSPPESVSAEASPRSDAADTEAFLAPSMPAHIAELIQRQVAARDAFPTQAPASGLLIRLWELPKKDAPWPFDGALAMLLDRQDVSGFWHGWMVAGESDYATDADVLLEPEDEPFDPSAGVIQIWNPLRLRIEDGVKPLGRVATERMEAMRSLATATRAGGVMSSAARPGRMQLRDIAGVQHLCGTPLESSSDPRWAYRALYGAAATKLQEAWNLDAAPATVPRITTASSSGGWAGWVLGLLRPGPAFAAMATVLILVQTVALVSLMPVREAEDLYRGSSVACDDGPRIRVVFKPEAQQADLVILLRKVEATLTAGPSETGELWLKFPKGSSIDGVLAQLKSSPLVLEAIVIESNGKGCTK